MSEIKDSTFSPLGPAGPRGPTGPGAPCLHKTNLLMDLCFITDCLTQFSKQVRTRLHFLHVNALVNSFFRTEGVCRLVIRDSLVHRHFQLCLLILSHQLCPVKELLEKDGVRRYGLTINRHQLLRYQCFVFRAAAFLQPLKQTHHITQYIVVFLCLFDGLLTVLSWFAYFSCLLTICNL